ncbi:MAG: polyphosphate:AMP phosphotransferase [Deltaproteobacteria bacterium]|nr:MAG: polyphosphate:AMP phosphotransferase [Deltaproteobacteria bacterium]
MFEAIELGHKVSKEEFAVAEVELRTRLLAVQRELRAAKVPVVILVNGVEGAGKSEVTNRLSKWLDTRGLVTHTFWSETDEERESPGHWRFWKRLPERGQIAVFFGSWYTYPIVERALGRMDDHVFLRAMNRINDLERLLTLDGTLIIKLWFHLSKADQEKRLGRLAQHHNGKKGDGRKPTPWEKAFTKHYDVFAEVSESAIRATDSGASPWHLIESKNRRFRDVTAGRVILAACEARVAETWTGETVHDATPTIQLNEEPSAIPVPQRTILDTVDLGRQLEDDEYRAQLKKYQRRLGAAVWEAWSKGIASVVVFEGWDAGGKGGAIRRVTASMDARLYRVVPIAAPTQEELAHHYLWRFWKHVPRDGYVRIFDRSWYGRVLVERVEGYAKPAEWRRAYRELTHFERQLTEHNVVVTKFWLHLSQEEQLRRFEERQQTAWKLHKITEEDWRNRDKWPAYASAVGDMVARTSTADAPWVIVPGDDKRFARVEVVKTLAKRMEAALAKG